MINPTALLAVLSLSLSPGAPPTGAPPTGAPTTVMPMTVGGTSQDAPIDTTLILGMRPAVVAFFGIPTSAFAERPGLRQVSTDLHDFLADAASELEAMGVDAQEAYAQRVSVLAEGREWTLPVASGLPVGYYLWSPEGLAYVCRGVRRGVDLVDIVDLFLQEVRGGEPSLRQCERQDK